MWLIDALGAAVTNAALGLEQKRISAKAEAFLLSAWTRLWSMPLTIAVFIAFPQPWHLAGQFWPYLLICGTLTAAGTYLTYIAYTKLDFAVVFPLLSLSPAIAIAASWLIDRTRPTLMGVLGISLVVIGSYALTSGPHKGKTPLNRAGTWAIITVAVLYAFTTSYDKLGVAASSPAVWTGALNIFIALVQWPLSLLAARYPKTRQSFPASLAWKAGTLVGAVMLLQMYALQAGGYVPFVLAIKQLSVLFAIVISWYALREAPARRRFLSAVVITTGAVIIALT